MPLQNNDIRTQQLINYLKADHPRDYMNTSVLDGKVLVKVKKFYLEVLYTGGQRKT